MSKEGAVDYFTHDASLHAVCHINKLEPIIPFSLQIT
jgi:hypothetical protein